MAQGDVSVLLKRYRLAAGLSQEALAAQAGVSARAISDLERGLHRAPRLATLGLLADALTLTPDQRALLLTAARPEAPAATGVPPVATPRRPPVAPTRLLGRQRERARAHEIMREHGGRLLTLTGPGGVGKTRLALQIAEDVASSYSDGVVFVDLASSLHSAEFLPALALALGLREEPGAALADQVRAHLDERHLIVVLDTFEHILDAAPVLADLLATCRGATFLVTSRTPLMVRAEHIVAIAPLEPADARELFCERARAVREDVDLAPRAVAAICEQLDHLPLAIELAAAQTRTFSLDQLASQLNGRLLQLGGLRDLPARQRTMADTMAWSYHLLEASRQRLFRALGAFTGSWTVQAAAAVYALDDSSQPTRTLAALADLTDASLIVADNLEDRAQRFRMLDVVRAYALEQLRAEGEEDACRQRHAAYYADLAGSAAVLGPERETLLAASERDLPNARAALEWAERQGLAAVGMRLAGFARLWYVRGQIGEALSWQERMLALDDRIRMQGGPAAPPQVRVERLFGLARTLIGFGDLERAAIRAAEARTLALETGDDDGASQACATVGMVAQAAGQLEEAAAAFAESFAHAQRSTRRDLQHRALYALAELARLGGDYARASRLCEEALSGARAVGNVWDSAVITTMLGHLNRHQGANARARGHFRAALALFRDFETPTFTAWCLEGFAAVLSDDGYVAEAVRLCAAASTLREQAHTPLPPGERASLDALLASARASLHEPAFGRTWSQGLLLSRDTAIAEALAFARRPRPSAAERLDHDKGAEPKIRAFPS